MVESAIVVDGATKEWDGLPLTTGDKPRLMGAAENWQGPTDASLRFATSHDERFVYFAAEVTDDAVVSGDALELRFDARWIGERVADSRLRTGTYSLTVPAPTAEQTATVKLPLVGKPDVGSADVSTARTPTGWTVEVAVPISALTKNQTADWHSFQMTPVVVDIDDANEKPAQIIWRGTADFATRSTNFGHFVRSK